MPKKITIPAWAVWFAGILAPVVLSLIVQGILIMIDTEKNTAAIEDLRAGQEVLIHLHLKE